MRDLLSPRALGAHLAALVAVALAVLLGVWQLGEWRDARADAARDLSRDAPVALDTLLGPDDPFGQDAVGRPVEVSGTWQPEASVVVTGRERDGRPGSWVATPLLTASGSAIYVVRGFTGNRGDGAAAATAPTGDARLVGLLQPAEGTGAVDEDRSDDVLPQLRTADLVQRLDEDLYGGYVVLDPERSADLGEAAAGLERATPEQLPDAGRGTALRNILYALEWWCFAVFALVVWGRWARDTVVRRAAHSEGPAAADRDGAHPVPSGP